MLKRLSIIKNQKTWSNHSMKKMSDKEKISQEDRDILNECINKKNYKGFIKKYDRFIRYKIRRTLSSMNVNFSEFKKEEAEIHIYLKVYKKLFNGSLKSYDPDRPFAALSFINWIAKICVNATFDYMTKKYPDIIPFDPMFLDIEDPEAMNEKKMLDMILIADIEKKIPPDKRELFDLVKNEYEPKKIAEILKTKPDTARKRIERLRKFLRSFYK